MIEQQPPRLSAFDAREKLRSRKMRVTATRVAVLQCVVKNNTPLSHADVIEKLAGTDADPSTLFRCLTDLADAGLLHRVDVGDGVRRFENSSAAGPHAHFVCTTCGKIVCLRELKLDIQTQSNLRSLPGVATDVILKGHCTKCRPMNEGK